MIESDTNRTHSSLVESLKDSSQQDRWSEFYGNYARLIRSVARSKGVAEDDLDDVVQDTMVSVAAAIARFQYDPSRSRFKTWLMRLTLSRISDLLRRKARRPQVVPILEGMEEHGMEHGVAGEGESVWEQEWCAALTEVALQRLKAVINVEMFQVFFLHCHRGIPAEEVARTLEVTRAYVYLVKFRILPKYEKIVGQIRQEWET